LFGVAALIIYDGLTGPQLAPANSATVLAWVHYRGLVLVALLMVGNLFCSSCPFTLPRTLAKKLSLSGGRWPAALRNKWLSVGGLLLIFFLYEWLDLWSSPWLTAWLAVAYFVASFALEIVFSESAFCKYVCPLGAFNFVYSMASPFQITARDGNVCRDCEGRECVNGSPDVLGCGTELFVPTIDSNMDCTFCLDCARACPYDNVALQARAPWRELIRELGKRRDLALLIVALAFFGFFNAFGMVPPVIRLQQWLALTLGIGSEVLQLALIFLLGAVALPALLLELADRLSGIGSGQSRGHFVGQFSTAFVPLGLGIWLAHYGFHFSIGALTLFPVLHSFILDHGWDWLPGPPNWDVGFLIPYGAILPLQIGAVSLGFFGGLSVLSAQSLRVEKPSRAALLRLLPWAVLLTLLTIASLAVFSQPMQMRGVLEVIS
jgi:ferredoxin